MKTLLTFLTLLALFAPSPAKPILLEWNPNPQDQMIAYYCVYRLPTDSPGWVVAYTSNTWAQVLAGEGTRFAVTAVNWYQGVRTESGMSDILTITAAHMIPLYLQIDESNDLAVWSFLRQIDMDSALNENLPRRHRRARVVGDEVLVETSNDLLNWVVAAQLPLQQPGVAARFIRAGFTR